MLLAGMLDLGLPASVLTRTFRDLGLSSVKLTTRRVIRDFLPAAQVRIHAPQAAVCRSSRELFQRVNTSRLPDVVKGSIRRVVRALAHAEAKAHGVSINDVVFHQLAGADTLAAVAGFCVGLAHFNIRAVYSSPVPVSRWHRDHQGHWRAAPGPATQQLLRHFPTIQRREQFEWVTPTGAAVLAALGSPQPPPAFYVRGIGRAVGLLRPLASSSGPLKFFLAEAA